MEKNKFIIEQYSDFFRNNDCKIEIPKHIVYIGDEVFKNQDKIKKVTLHPNVKKMGTSVFEGCSNLQRVKFLGESELVVIPEKCFKNCTSIESFEIPPEVGVIKKYAFSGCTGIKHIVIPKEVIAVESGAFDKWTEDQTIEMYSNFKFGVVCKANIINHSINTIDFEEYSEYETSDGRYMYAVQARCGHVGREHYIPITFPVIAGNKKEAASITRNMPRVKHHHKFAIQEVKQISLEEFQVLVEHNNNDPYLKIKNSSEQKKYIDNLVGRIKLEEKALQ